MSESEEISITIKSSADKKYNLTLVTSTTVSGLKDLIAAESDIPSARQRLIYSGRVLRDSETLASYGIKSGHTIHLVKGAAPRSSSSATSSQQSSTTATTPAATPAVPSNIAAGQGAFNPLAGLTGARYAGHAQLPSASMFGPDGGMGAMPNEDQMAQMMDSPMFQEGMQQLLNNPQMMDYLISSNPQLSGMGPQIRQMMQSDMFRSMVSNPSMMRDMMQMQRSMGMGGFGGAGATPSFPAPGSTTTTTSAGNTDTTSNTTAGATNTPATGAPAAAPANPFAGLFGAPAAGGAAANPFSLLGFPAAGSNANTAAPATNPLYNPELMNMFLSSMGGGAGQNAAPADTRPPEERYESQLRQLNELGFVDFDRNVLALRRSGGNVQGAIEALLDNLV